MMTTLKRMARSPVTTAVLFILAAVLLLSGTIGGTRAILTYYSETYTSRVQMYDIGVSLMENGSRISWRDYGSAADGSWSENTGVLLGEMIAEGERVKPGVAYGEALTVRNSGSIDEYVRVTLHKYWLDTNGDKLYELSPDLIDLHLVNVGDGWTLDQSSSTPERIVLYYDRILPTGDSTPAFTDTLTIDPAVATSVTQEIETEDGGRTVVTTYDYDGVRFQIEVEVDAVQIHNAEDAIRSAWGRQVSVSDGVLSLT